MSVLFFPWGMLAQNGPVKLVFAQTVSDYQGKPNTTKAVGNVQFQHNNTRLFCDSAIFLQTPNLIYAYSHVQINQGDTVNLFCDSLIYDGNTKISRLRGHVRFRDNEFKMVTDSLDYDGNTSCGIYKAGAVITSIKEDLKLTSVKGYYYSDSKTFFFKDSVHVTHPEYELFSDTLEFRTNSSTAHFHGPTRVLLDSSELSCNRGIYYTDEKLIRLWNGANLYQEKRTFFADSLIYDQAADFGEGFCHVRLYDSTEKVLFLADYLQKNPANEKLVLHDNAHVVKFGDKDTLFLSADTIFHFLDTSTDLSTSIAVRNVEIINGGVYVACDSAHFSEADSLMKLHKNPVLWADKNQVTGDSVLAVYYKNEFHQLKIYNNAFITGERDSIHYDQIKGVFMTAWLDSSKIQRARIEENAQTLYYVDESRKDTAGVEFKALTAMNKIDCNFITVTFANSEVQNVSFNEQPTGSYIPIDQVPEKDLFLRGFLWQIDRKPKPILLE